MSHDPDHAPFRNDLLSAGWGLLPLIYRQNLKFLTTTITKISKAVKNVETGVVRGHSRSPFDRVHMCSYSTLVETMHLSCIVFEK